MTSKNFLYINFSIYIGTGLLIIYAKLLWPQVFGRMQNEGISFSTAVLDISLHTATFFTLTLCVAVGAIWSFITSRTKE